MPEKNRDTKAVWFEIPAYDFNRAVGFYETVLDTHLKREEAGSYRMGIFPAKNKTAGCIISGEGCQPGYEGTLVYVNANGQLPAALERVAKAGGEVVQDTTLLPDDMGLYAIIRDTEGNRIGLHAC